MQTPLKLSPFARQGPLNKHMPPTPKKTNHDEELEPPSKRTSHRLLNYDQSHVDNIDLSKTLNQVKFPSKVPNSPYSVKNITPATPISMMMELKNWLQQSVNRVRLNAEKGVSDSMLNFIRGDEENKTTMGN